MIPNLDPSTMNSQVCQKGSHTPPVGQWSLAKKRHWREDPSFHLLCNLELGLQILQQILD